MLATAAALCVLTWIGDVLTRVAKRGGGGIQALGTAVMRFGWGNMRDPSNNPVKEAYTAR